MKQPKPMNRQISLPFEPGLSIWEMPTDMPLQQQEEIESALVDLLLSVAINSREIHCGGDNDR
jgi:hypothetical protein